MKRQITSFKELYIPNPCHQDWECMTDVEKGKFCEHCKKVVYDFSDKTEQDFNFLFQLNKGNICARFAPDQIDQDYAYIANAKKNSLWNRIKRVGSFFTTLIVLKLSTMRIGFAQQSFGALRANFGHNIKMNTVDPNERRSEDPNILVKGYVLIEGTETGLGNVFVKLYDSKNNLVATTVSGNDGDFYMTLSDSLNLKQSFLIVADKDKVKRSSKITTYSKDKKKISVSDFGNVILVVDIHNRTRRNLLGIKKFRGPMGCPKFR